MANQKQAASKRLKMSERAQQQLDLHFPGFPSQWLWRRKTNDGFTTLPRTLPLVMQAVDAQSKGQPAGHTLFCLWVRSPDHPLVRKAVALGRVPFGSPTLSDQALMPFPSMKMGPGKSSRSHTADEFIFVKEIEEAITLYLELLDGAEI